MSLISVKNFVSPFTNTTHVVTILLVTVLFALFRLQGGSVRVDFDANSRTNKFENPNSAPLREDSVEGLLHDNTSTNHAAPMIPRDANTSRIPDRGKITITAEDEDLLGQMIGKQPLAPQKQPDANSKKPDASRNGGGLEDIEKSLGLR